ncbi:MAG: hypothetical protein RDU14_02540 [Melioribacteraceae bacterium]|nr:hypothetical protein [Melioribacteraceae bacterium]
MKKTISNLFSMTLILLISYSCTANKETIDQSFYYSFASENNRLKGDMFLSEEFNYNLQNLTYDYYLNYLSDNLKGDDINILKLVKNADKQYFESDSLTFRIALFYSNDKILLFDNADTPLIDKVDTLKTIDKIPLIKDYFQKYKMQKK